MSEQAQKSTPARRRLPVAVNSLNTLVLTRDITLATTFAADQLHAIAKKDSLVMFMAVYADIFGVDIPTEAYKALYEDAQKKASILYPSVEVAGAIGNGAKASFNSATRTISVSEKAVLEALEDNKARGELMTMLIEEYGHYLDYLLRYHYAKNSNPDASGDEGAKFTYSMYVINPLEQSDQHFADVTINGQAKKMVWDFSELHRNLKKHVNERRQNSEDHLDNLEFFKAGLLKPHGEFGHQDVVEEALLGKIGDLVSFKGVAKKIVDTIYLGNWLRDFSQAVDPMIVRPLSMATASASGGAGSTKQPAEDTTLKTKVPDRASVPDGVLAKLNPFNYVTNRTVEFRPVMLSVEAIATVVELAATKEFIHKKDVKKDELESYHGHLHKLRTEYVPINPQALGVYRPEEHIDNPKGVGQTETGANRGDKALYSKFVGFIPNDHPMHRVNRQYGLKNYIRSDDHYTVEGEAFLTSYAYIANQLKQAGVVGGLDKPKALVDFGAALHTLEDYFAHTNYAEISLIKSVEPMVFPWVDEVREPTGFQYQYEDLFRGRGLDRRYVLVSGAEGQKSGHELASYIPIVTGTFGLVDTAASVLPILNEHLFSIEIAPWEKAKSGERTFADVLVRELLADLDKAQLDAYGNQGSNDNTYVYYFDMMLDVRDVMVTAKDYVLPDFMEEKFHWITQHIKQILNFTQFFLIKNIASVLNDAQVALDKDLNAMEAGKFRIGMDPSHTQVAKDDPDHPLHELAGRLAVEAVKQVGEKMLQVWRGKGSVETSVIPVVDRLMRHPSVSTWQDTIVSEWARANPDKVCASCSPSVVVDRVLHSIEEIDETLFRVEKYLAGDTATGKVVSFFANDEEAKRDINRLKTHVQGALKKSQLQLVRAKKIKAVWDGKFSKPAYCKVANKSDVHAHGSQSRPGGSGAGETQSSTSSAAASVPGVHRYRVKKGDTLWAIARNNNVSVDALKKSNRLTSDTIYPGQELSIPGV